MFIAMNRFKVAPGREGDFEEMWLSRDSHLKEVPGFVAFHLLKGPEGEGYRLYSSHAIWASKAAFEAWTQSDAFRKAHQGARPKEGIYLGPPHFEGFEVLQTVEGERS
jgi:heme-degrading monooxygenase HmoA